MSLFWSRFTTMRRVLSSSPGLIPEQFSGREILLGTVPEKTPEESDDDERPHENRSKSHIPGGN